MSSKPTLVGRYTLETNDYPSGDNSHIVKIFEYDDGSCVLKNNDESIYEEFVSRDDALEWIDLNG